MAVSGAHDWGRGRIHATARLASGRFSGKNYREIDVGFRHFVEVIGEAIHREEGDDFDDLRVSEAESGPT